LLAVLGTLGFPVELFLNALPAAGRIGFEESHPIVYNETDGHGICGTRRILFPGVITHRVGDAAQTPEGIKDEDTSYLLVSMYETLWTHRDDIGAGRVFDQPFDYRGRVLPAALDGDDFGEDRADSPWGDIQAIGDGLSRGDWFLDPAQASAYHASFEGEYSLDYVHSPYLVDLGRASN